MRIVIVGNGVAGIEAAIAVRARRADWSITIVSEESDHFIARTALMYVAAGQLRESDLEPLERDAYLRYRFTRVRARATGIDAKAKRLLLAGDPESLEYDRLLIACGSRARLAPWPGGALEGVGYFVTLADLEWLAAELDPLASTPSVRTRADASGSPYASRAVAGARRGRPAREPVVVGGGLIGIEVTEVLASRHLRPRFVVREESFWPTALSPREGAFVVEQMRAHGVEVELGTEMIRILGDEAGTVAAVETSRGTPDADLVAVAIGVVPNTEWLGSAVALDERSRAIRVDGALRTSAADVLAAGDCAAVASWDGTTRPEQLWYTAREQGRIAGARLSGDDVTYARGTWYNSAKLFDVEYTTVGLVDAELPAQTSFVAEERGRLRSQTRIIASEGRFIGGSFLGRRWDHSVLVEWIEEERPVAWVLQHLDEAAFDTELVPPLGSAHRRWEES